MAYSAHRPGRFDSQGRIIIHDEDRDDVDHGDDEPRYLEREFAPVGAPVADGRADEEGTAAPETDPFIADPFVSTPSTARPRRPRAGEREAAASGSPAGSEQEQESAEQDAAAQKADERAAPTRTPRRARRPRTPGSRLRTMAILGGADGHVLDVVPSETPRFVQMFFVLLGTALVSALSMLFALTTGVQIAVWLAVPLAIVWAGIIFNLDRFLTSTMTATRSIRRLVGLALPRVIMALIIGVVVAEPVVLQAFHNDIAREVASTNIVQSQADQTALDEGPEKQALDDATAHLAELQNQAATGIVAGTDSASASQAAAQSTVDDLTEKLAAQQQVIDDARALYQCELDGTGAGEVEGCTNVQGEGASSDAAQAQLAAAQSTYDALATQLRDANETLAAAEGSARDQTSASEAQNREAAQSQLPAAQASYDQALAAYNERASSVAGTNAGAIGLLSQISGLNRLSEKEPTILWAHLLIAGLFLMIELLPVLVKVLTSFGDPSLYEKAAAVRKQVSLERVNADGFRDRAAIISGETGASARPA